MPTSTDKPVKLFISYSHKDMRYLQRLETHLVGLKQQGLIDDWHDRKIVAGQEWDKVIGRNIEASDIVLLLVSPDFMNSQYVNEKEIKRAIEKHNKGEAHVIPVIIRPSDWEWASFANLQALPRNGRPVTTWSNRDEAWMDVVKGIRAAVNELKSKRQPKGLKQDVGDSGPISVGRYRKAVESVWADGELTKQEVEWLDDYAGNDLVMSPGSISDIEIEVMGATKEAILERQKQAADERYRKAVAEAWTGNRLSDAAARGLRALASDLDLSADRAAVIEREEKERQRHLDELYARARRLHRDRDWQAVVEVFASIHAQDPAYLDQEGLLESANEALRGRRAAAMYDQGLQHMDAEEWQQALESFEEVQRLEPGYRNIDSMVSQVQRKLTARLPDSHPAAPWEYIDFDLEIGEEREPRKYSLVVRSSDGEAQEEMRFPFDERQLQNKLRDLEIALLRSSGTRRRTGTGDERAVKDFGRALFEALLGGGVRARYEANIREARRQNKGLRLKLHVRPPELSVLPWEFLYDPDRDYLSLSSKTPLVRYLDLAQPVEPLRVTPPLKLLGMVVNPAGLNPLDLEHEKRVVEEATKTLRANGMLELTWLEGQTWRDLQRAMRRGEWNIFHFIGHGEFDPASGESEIVFSNREGRKHLLRATDLSRLLDDHYPLRLVFLNTCEGARGSERDAFSSTAATLVRSGIPAVVAMQYEITDKAAIEFSRAFYEAVADGLPVDAAVAEARTAVSMESILEWGTPVLYMRSPDGNIFDIQQTEDWKREHPERLEELYARARQSHQIRDWQVVVDVFEQIHALDPEYRDQEGLLESASEALERGRSATAMYDQGLQHMDAGEWQQALESFEEVQQLEPDYRDIERLLARVRHELSGRTEPQRDKFPIPPGWEPDKPPPPPGW